MSRQFTFTLRSGVRYDFETGEFFDGTFSLDEDLIVPMSFINRYNGQTSLPWSDAAHAVIVHDIVASQFPDDVMLRGMALHHDDEEVIVGDRTTPMKRWICHLEQANGIVGDAFAIVADRAQRAIERALGMESWRAAYDASPAARAVVKTADDLAYAAESRILRARKTHGDTPWLPPAEVDRAIGLMEDYRMRAHRHHANVRFTYGTGAPAADAFRRRHMELSLPTAASAPGKLWCCPICRDRVLPSREFGCLNCGLVSRDWKPVECTDVDGVVTPIAPPGAVP